MHTLGLVCQSQLGLVWQGSCGDDLGRDSTHGHYQPAWLIVDTVQSECEEACVARWIHD